MLFSARGEQRMEITWMEPKRLRIWCDRCKQDEIRREVARVGDVEIKFDLPDATPSPAIGAQ